MSGVLGSRLRTLSAGWFGHDNRVARWFVVLIIAFSSAVTLVISAIQLTIEYRDMRSDLERQFEAAMVFLPNLEASVWDFDETQIQLALNALVRQPYVSRASLTATVESQRWSAGKPDAGSVVARVYPLRRNSHGEVLEIGRLELVASLTQIYWKVADRALGIVVSNAIKTFMVALFALYLFRRLITRRLERLAVKVGQLAPAPMTQAMPAGLDELQSVEWVLDDTGRKLELANARLNGLNRHLTEEIAEKEALLQNALVGIAMIRAHQIVSCNRRFEELFGYEAGAIAGLPVQRLFADEKEWLAADAAAHEAGMQAVSFSVTARMVRRNGTPFWAEISGATVVSEQAEQERIWVLSDVSEAKFMEAEMVRLRAELWKVLESELVRHTVAAMAHEVNQPLGSIAALCEAAQRTLAAGADANGQGALVGTRLGHIVERMAAESVRAGALLRKLMQELHTPAVAVEPTQLGSALKEVARLAPSHGYGECEIIVECKPGLGPVLVNRQQLEKVLLNLISNAAEAMRSFGRPKGRIWLAAGFSDDGRQARVTVRDEGPGIGRKMESQVFHPFVSTKPGNLGMGLTICRSLIEARGGTFWLAPDEGPGAVFHFTLPFAE